MSADAECYVETLQVKGSARELLRIIAKHIPEGETTTPLIGMGDLGKQARLGRRTVVRWLGELVDAGEIAVIDAAPGLPARYQLVRLTGAAPITNAPLPLRADLQPVPRRAPSASSTPDLFDRPADEDPAIHLRQTGTGWLRHLCQSGVGYLVDLCQTITRWRFRPVSNWRRFLPLDIDDARARDVLQLKTTTTTAAPRDEPSTPDEVRFPPRAPVHPWHAWCDGRVHVPKDLHQELLVRLGRFPHETAAAQEARLRAFYIQTCAALPPYAPIGVTEFTFWNRAFAATFAASEPRAGNRAPPRERGRPDGVIGSRCSHQPLCATNTACIERTIAEGRAEKEQTG